MNNKPGPTMAAGLAVSPRKRAALAALCLKVLPIWGRQLATSRTQSEVAVTEMLKAFSAIGPHLETAVQQSKQIIEAMVPANGAVGMNGLVAACELELTPLAQSMDAESAAPIQRALDLIRQSVRTLENATGDLPYDAKTVGEKIEQMYIGFQYQDRVNQMMSLLQDDMANLQTILETPHASHDALAIDPWLTRLESLYAMAEQRRDHDKDGHAASAGMSNETSFF